MKIMRHGNGSSETYHTSDNDYGGKVLKIGHIPPNILVDSVDEVTDPCQKWK